MNRWIRVVVLLGGVVILAAGCTSGDPDQAALPSDAAESAGTDEISNDGVTTEQAEGGGEPAESESEATARPVTGTRDRLISLEQERCSRSWIEEDSTCHVAVIPEIASEPDGDRLYFDITETGDPTNPTVVILGWSPLPVNDQLHVLEVWPAGSTGGPGGFYCDGDADYCTEVAAGGGIDISQYSLERRATDIESIIDAMLPDSSYNILALGYRVPVAEEIARRSPPSLSRTVLVADAGSGSPAAANSPEELVAAVVDLGRDCASAGWCEAAPTAGQISEFATTIMPEPLDAGAGADAGARPEIGALLAYMRGDDLAVATLRHVPSPPPDSSGWWMSYSPSATYVERCDQHRWGDTSAPPILSDPMAYFAAFDCETLGSSPSRWEPLGELHFVRSYGDVEFRDHPVANNVVIPRLGSDLHFDQCRGAAIVDLILGRELDRCVDDDTWERVLLRSEVPGWSEVVIETWTEAEVAVDLPSNWTVDLGWASGGPDALTIAEFSVDVIDSITVDDYLDGGYRWDILYADEATFIDDETGEIDRSSGFERDGWLVFSSELADETIVLALEETDGGVVAWTVTSAIEDLPAQEIADHVFASLRVL